MGRRTFIIMSLLPTGAEFIVTFGPEKILIEVISRAHAAEELAKAGSQAGGKKPCQGKCKGDGSCKHDKPRQPKYRFTLSPGESQTIDIEDDDDDVITAWRGGEDIFFYTDCRESGFDFRLRVSEATRRGIAYRHLVFAQMANEGENQVS